MTKASQLLKLQEAVPVRLIRLQMKSFFNTRGKNEYKYWMTVIGDRYPDVDPAFLIDIKNDITKEMGIEIK